jgi:hypothetical protein
MALALMMPLVVTMRHLLRQRMGERRFPTADPPRETCLRDRPYPAFRRGVAMRRPRRQWPTRHPGGGDVLWQDGAVLPLRLMQERLPHRQAPPRLHRAMAGDLHHPLDMRMGRYARDRERPAVSARHECTGLTDRSRGWVIHPRLPTSHPLVAEPSRHTHLEQVSPGGVSRAQGTHTQTPRMCGGSLSLCDSNPRTHRGCIWLKTQVLQELFPPIPILPAPVLPQQVDPVLRVVINRYAQFITVCSA